MIVTKNFNFVWFSCLAIWNASNQSKRNVAQKMSDGYWEITEEFFFLLQKKTSWEFTVIAAKQLRKEEQRMLLFEVCFLRISAISKNLKFRTQKGSWSLCYKVATITL